MDVMATNQRSTNSALKKSLPEQVIESPAYFDFDQLIYILETMRSKANPLGIANEPQKEAARIRSNPVMHQEHGEISKVEVFNTISTLPEIYTNFLNLIGINGPLPLPYTEIILERLKNKDKAALHFLDVFNHRLVSLWHKLRKKNYPHLYRSLPKDTPIGKVVTDLSGFSPIDNINHTVFFDYYWRRSRSLISLLNLIQGFFKIQVKITPFQGCWRIIQENYGSKIGVKKGQYNLLGKTSILGLRAWDQSAGFLITLPSLTWAEVQEFLPFEDKKLGGSNFEKLKKILHGFIGIQPKVFLNVNLMEAENKGATLNSKFALGLNSWIKGNNPETARVRIL